MRTRTRFWCHSLGSGEKNIFGARKFYTVEPNQPKPAVAGAASVNASKDDCSEPRPSASAECDGEFTGPECKACKSDSFGLGCIEPCTVNSCSKHGRCRGWSGQYRRMIARSLVGAPAECDGEFAGPECKACKSDSFGLGCIEPTWTQDRRWSV